jgi:hypothetical protein
MTTLHKIIKITNDFKIYMLLSEKNALQQITVYSSNAYFIYIFFLYIYVHIDMYFYKAQQNK